MIEHVDGRCPECGRLTQYGVEEHSEKCETGTRAAEQWYEGKYGTS